MRLGQQLYLNLGRVFLFFFLVGMPLVLLTPPPAVEFVALCLKRDAYRAASGQKPLSPAPTRLFQVRSGAAAPAGAHRLTAALPPHQVAMVSEHPPRYYGLRVPLAQGGEIWAESRLPQGYYQLASSWQSTFRWYFGLTLFYLLLLGSSSLLLRRIRRRLECVARAARRLTEGDLTTVCPTDARDPLELTLLVTRLNEMGAALRRRHQALQERRRQLEDTALELNRRLAEVSHDLRTPLTSILGYAQLYREQGLAPLRTVETEGQALLERVGRWLESCRLESGALELRLGEVYLHDALEEAFYLAQAWRPLEAEVELPAKSPVVRADPFLLPRVLARLLLELNCRRLHLTLGWPCLTLQGSEPLRDAPDPALISLDCCRNWLQRQDIEFEMDEQVIVLTWSAEWSD